MVGLGVAQGLTLMLLTLWQGASRIKRQSKGPNSCSPAPASSCTRAGCLGLDASVLADAISNMPSTCSPTSKLVSDISNSGDLACSLVMLAKHRSEILLLRSATHEYIERATQLYASHTETVVHYANYHRYDAGVYIEQYSYDEGVPGHFSKVRGVHLALFQLGYSWVLVNDWDSWMSPRSSPPFTPWTTSGASILLQSEPNLCTCIFGIKRSHFTQTFLSDWWGYGQKKCCAGHTYDQIAFKHVLGQYLASKAECCQVPVDNTEEPDTTGWSVLPDENVHFVSPLETQVQFHNALGLWGGSIQPHLPALFYHHGHFIDTHNQWHGNHSIHQLVEHDLASWRILNNVT